MADSDDNLEYQDFNLYRAIYDRVNEFYRWWQDKFGWYIQDTDQTTRARLKVDESNTSLTMVSKDQSKKFTIDLENNSIKLENVNSKRAVEITTDGINFYDDSGNKRRADMHLSTSWYAEGGVTLVRKDEPAGSSVNDTSTGVLRFSFNNLGQCGGTNGTRTWTLAPSVLSSDASFVEKAECDGDGNPTGGKHYLAET